MREKGRQREKEMKKLTNKNYKPDSKGGGGGKNTSWSYFHQNWKDVLKHGMISSIGAWGMLLVLLFLGEAGCAGSGPNLPQ